MTWYRCTIRFYSHSIFLLSVYINLLPSTLYEAFSPHVENPPPRLYNCFWLNSLLYANGMVFIGTAESMPHLLTRLKITYLLLVIVGAHISV
jgi:hypothetical protein